MIKRPISPSDELPTMASPQPNSHFASLRRAVQARPNSFPSSARAVCVLLAALCLVFFFVETSETQKTVQTTTPTVSSSSPSRVASTGGAPAETEEQAKSDTAAAEETLSPVSRGGLRRFSSFKEYVEASRAQGDGSSLPMPVVNVNGQDVTVPSAIIIGAQRTGTSTLHSMLSQHPGVGTIEAEPVRKTDRGFMTQDPQSYPRDAEWPGDNLEMDLPTQVLGDLLEQIARPYTESESRGEKSEASDLVTVGLSPGYFASPLAPYRLKLALPDVKIVVVMRDPTDRYYSELREILCAEEESEVDWDDVTASFAMPSASKDYLSRAVLNYSPYDKKCLGEGASAVDLWDCQSAMLKSHRPLLEGMYSSQLRRWWRAFDKSQVLVVESAKLFEEPEKTASEVAKFAGLVDDHAFFEFAVDRQASCDPRRRGSAISSAFSRRKESEPQLRKWYTDHNDMLSELMGKEMGWNDRIRSAYTRSPPS